VEAVKVTVSVVAREGVGGRARRVDWPEGWPVPHVGDPVAVRYGARDFDTLYVHAVEWYPHGDCGKVSTATHDPFVHVILHPDQPTKRRRWYMLGNPHRA
jgi:hypothetical protein